MFDAYIAIELANLTPEVERRPSVIVNYVRPGFCKSELLAKTGQPLLALKIAEWLLARTPAYGALCYTEAACKEGKSRGKYLNHQIAYPYVESVF